MLRKCAEPLRYEKSIRKVKRHHCSSGNIWHKHQLVAIHTGNPVNWKKSSQKLDLYINEERTHELLVASQQPLTKGLTEHMGIKIIGCKCVGKEAGTIFTTESF